MKNKIIYFVALLQKNTLSLSKICCKLDSDNEVSEISYKISIEKTNDSRG